MPSHTLIVMPASKAMYAISKSSTPVTAADRPILA